MLRRTTSEIRRLLEAYSGDGVMVAFWIPEKLAKKIAVKGGEDPKELHLTVCYLGKASELGKPGLKVVKRICKQVARNFEPLEARLGGLGRFAASETSDAKDVLYASIDSPRLEAVRQTLLRGFSRAKIEWPTNHGYTPHVTLAYIDPKDPLPIKRLAANQLKLEELVLAVGGERKMFPLTGRKILTGAV